MEVSARIVVAAPVRLLVGWDGTPSSPAIQPRDPEPNPTAATLAKAIARCLGDSLHISRDATWSIPCDEYFSNTRVFGVINRDMDM